MKKSVPNAPFFLVFIVQVNNCSDRLSTQGSLCEIELDATQVNDPMDASLVASYAAKKCKYWIFDCKWGDTHSRTLWQWNQQAQSKTIFDKIFKIAKA